MGIVDRMRDKAEDLATRAKPAAENLRDKAKPVAERLKDKAGQVTESIKESAENFSGGLHGDERAGTTTAADKAAPTRPAGAIPPDTETPGAAAAPQVPPAP